MTESIVIAKIIELIITEDTLEDINEMTIVENKELTSKVTINVLERQLKEQIDNFVLQYGITNALIKLLQFQNLLGTIPKSSNVTLLGIGAKTLVDRLMGYYSSIVYNRLVKWIPKLAKSKEQNNQIDISKIINDVKTSPYTDEFLLGLSEDSLEQLNFWEIHSQKNDIQVALSNKTRIKSTSIKTLQRLYSATELKELLYDFSRILNNDDSLESVVFLRCLLMEVSEILKYSKTSKKDNPRQLKMPGF